MSQERYDKWCNVCYWLDDKYVEWDGAYVQGDGTEWMLCNEHFMHIVELKVPTRNMILKAWASFIGDAIADCTRLSRIWGIEREVRRAVRS